MAPLVLRVLSRLPRAGVNRTLAAVLRPPRVSRYTMRYTYTTPVGPSLSITPPHVCLSVYWGRGAVGIGGFRQGGALLLHVATRIVPPAQSGSERVRGYLGCGLGLSLMCRALAGSQ